MGRQGKKKNKDLPKHDDPFKELMRNELVRKQFIADFLGMPVEEVASTRLLNTFLWKRLKTDKQGIVDVLVELLDGTKVDIEVQLKAQEYWDKRTVFYIAKLYTDDLRRGEKYEKAKKCILISLLDFNLSGDREYHHVYRFRDKEGKEFTDMLEIHVVELRKMTDGDRPVDEWIRLLNAETKEELEMIGSATKNQGIREAVRELDLMNLPHNLKMLYDAKQKIRRDWDATLAYARKEGREQGLQQGRELGLQQGRELGLEQGRELGLEQGRELGLEQGREQGLQQGRELGLEQGRELGLEQGRELGLEQGRELGLQQGREQGIRAMVLDGVEDGLTQERIVAKLEKRFDLSREKAEEFYEKYGK